MVYFDIYIISGKFFSSNTNLLQKFLDFHTQTEYLFSSEAMWRGFGWRLVQVRKG